MHNAFTLILAEKIQPSFDPPLRLTAAIAVFAVLAAPAFAREPGWAYSPLPGEGDRATIGCDRDAKAQDHTCLAVRCEDDFSVALYLDTSLADDTGTWEMTIDRENKSFPARATIAPYGARIAADEDWLLERLRQGTFVYLRKAGDTGPFRFISLEGSLYAINAALAWCAPRVPASEPKGDPGV